jgi:hypothetical protein
MIDFRPNHIENYLVTLHTGQWFGWSDSKNKVYANLVIHDQTKTKPTEQECIDGLAQMQAEYDANEYKSKRAAEYPDFREYLDGIVKGDVAQQQAYIDACLAVKAKYPK